MFNQKNVIMYENHIPKNGARFSGVLKKQLTESNFDSDVSNCIDLSIQGPSGLERSKISAELVCSYHKILKGLMYRNQGDNLNMLFIFPYADFHGIWMKNTFVPLDILFLDDEGFIVDIYHSAEPLRTDIIYSPSMPVKFVLEVNGGFCQEHNLEVGYQIKPVQS